MSREIDWLDKIAGQARDLTREADSLIDEPSKKIESLTSDPQAEIEKLLQGR